MRTNSEKPAGGEPKKSNGEDCRFSPRALLLYEMAKHRATRMAEAYTYLHLGGTMLSALFDGCCAKPTKNRMAGRLKKIRRRTIYEGDNP